MSKQISICQKRNGMPNMKLAFIFPFTFGRFYQENQVPLSTTTLIGNIKEYFPDVIFSQICLYNELPFIIKKNKLNNGYDKMIDLIFADVEKNGIKVLENKNIYKKMPIFRKFFDELLSKFNLDKYDHYFFAVLDRDIKSFYAHFLLAAYLKKKYKNRRIIFGGIYGIGDGFSSLGQPDFIDSVVLGAGEESTREIIGCLLGSRKLKKTYTLYVPTKDRLRNLPDFSSIKKLSGFCYTQKRLECLYNTKLPGSNNHSKVLILPYRFSHGCFWRNCAYCSCSASQHEKFYFKETGEVVNDIKEMKEKYQARFFVFFNTNFNFNLNYAKELLRKIIKNKLNILWTDSFNLRIIDDELIKLMVKAGCFRVDVGMSTLNPKIQKLYNNIFTNEYIKNLVKISSAGIWVHINLISNLPYQYSVNEDIKTLKKYIKYIDGVSLNCYRPYNSNLEENYDGFNLKHIREAISLGNEDFLLPFLENNFNGSLEQRKKMFLDSYEKLDKFFLTNSIRPQKLSFNLLGYLYNQLGFERKDEIKKIIAQTDVKIDYNDKIISPRLHMREGLNRVG